MWKLRNLPNVQFMHFNDMKRDLPKSIREIADFLGIQPAAKTFQKIVEQCTFDYMKVHAETVTPLGGMLWQGGAQTFIHKGTNGRWKDALTSAESRAYEARAVKKLGEDCAVWQAGAAAEQDRKVA